MTKVTVISGFLGAGKTTLIKKLLEEAFQGEKIVLIENEFGEIGIDSGFLKDAGIEINEMNSGCICCSLVGDFGTALQQVMDQFHPDRILIEPSGVGKLSDVVKAVQDVITKNGGMELGCAVTDRWKPGIPEFRASHGGFLLTARDERGATLSPQQLLAMAALVELEHGGGRLAVPDDASAAVELVAAGFGKTVRRLGRDGEAARQLYRTLPWLRDAAFAATRLCACMTATGQRLEQLAGKTPRFSGWRREVTLTGDRAAVMARLSAGLGPDCRVGEGLRLRDRGGWVYLVPLARRCAVRVVAESDDMELAAELCDFYAGRVAEADREQGTK